MSQSIELIPHGFYEASANALNRLEHWKERIELYKDSDYLSERQTLHEIEHLIREIKRAERYISTI